MGALRRWLPCCCCCCGGGGGGGGGKGKGSVGDGLVWDVALKAHASGDYSVAVAQANEALEDQAQVFVSPAATLVGVYDGHGGPEAARFVNKRLFSLIQEYAAQSGGISAEVLEKAFGETEEEFAAEDPVRRLVLPRGRHRERDALRRQPRRLARRARPPRRRRRSPWPQGQEQGGSRAALQGPQRRRRGRPQRAQKVAPRRLSHRPQHLWRLAHQRDHPGVEVNRRRVPEEAGDMQEQPDAAAVNLPVPAAAAGDERGAVDQDTEAEARRPVRHLRVGRAVGAAHRRGGGGDRGRQREERRGDEASQGGAAGGGEEEGHEVREDQDDREGTEEALPRRHHRRRALPRQVPRQGRPRRRDRRHRRPRRRLLPQPRRRRPGGPDEARATLIDGATAAGASAAAGAVCTYILLFLVLLLPELRLHLRGS